MIYCKSDIPDDLQRFFVRSEIGLEQTPEAYVAELVGVFREVRRVLRRDGTVWLNLGDSYAGSGKGGNPENSKWAGFVGNKDREAAAKPNGLKPKDLYGLKPKDLIGIPWLVAFALRADGWYLRQEIIWAKGQPMPESVRDRCTKSHEQIFLLTKSPRYYFDAEAIAEPVTESTIAISQPTLAQQKGSYRVPGKTNGPMKAVDHGPTRNKRSVWFVNRQQFTEKTSHFATFPPDLIEPCIKAGTSEKGCCAKCGAPWKREMEIVGYCQRWTTGEDQYHTQAKGKHGATSAFTTGDVAVKKTTGWSPSCSCDGSPKTVPATILDCFGGAGTTGLVADRLQRNAILIELNPAYAAMAERRIQSDAGLFAGVEVS